MNYRELVKFFKGSTGKIIIFIIVVITLALIIIPLFTSNSDDTLKVEKNTAQEKRAFELTGTSKPFRVSDKDKQKQKLNTEEEQYRTVPPPPPIDGDGNATNQHNDPESSRRNNTAVSNTSRFNRIPRMSRLPSFSPSRTSSQITLVDSNDEGTKDEFISDCYAPFGRLIACKLINTLESGDTDTPLIAMVTEDLWWINSKGEKKLIIPAGTEVHGQAQGSKPLRNRITSGNDFVLVWQATSEMVGFELQLKGIALEKSNDPATKDRAAISDMSAGIPGTVIANENLAKFLAYTLAFGAGVAQGFQTQNVVTTNSSTIITSDGTTQNALATGAQNLFQLALQDVTQQIAKESYYIRVPAGTEFYLFVQQVINLDDAKIANTLLNPKKDEKKQQGIQTPDPSKFLNAFKAK